MASTGGLAQLGRLLLRAPLLTAVLSAVVVLGGGIFVFASGNGSDESGGGGGEIFLEPAASLGRDPFLDLLRSPVPTVVLARDLLPEDRQQGTASMTGGTVGLYGGTLNDSLCDREQMISFLTTNAGPGRAWAAIHQVTFEQVPAFIRSLTPMQLRLDTRVTNHGYRDGNAVPLQSVLQAGTAVLVDQLGVPRARCACGNPLLAPQAVDDPVFQGDPWTDFDSDGLVRVTPYPEEVPVFVLHNAATGGLFERPVGTDGKADKVRSGPAPKNTTSITATPLVTAAPTATAPTTTVAPTTVPAPVAPTTTTTTAAPVTTAAPATTEAPATTVPETTTTTTTTTTPTTQPPTTTSTAPPTVLITVPDLAGRTLDNAKAILARLQLNLVVGKAAENIRMGCGVTAITSQSPAAKTTAPINSSVTVNYDQGICLR